MTKEAYLRMCESLGEEPDVRVMPMDVDDLPSNCQIAVAMFNLMNDTFVPGDYPMYNGKDITGVPIVCDLFGIEEREERLHFMNLINILDSNAKDASQKAIEKARRKSKYKGNTQNIVSSNNSR